MSYCGVDPTRIASEVYLFDRFLGYWTKNAPPRGTCQKLMMPRITEPRIGRAILVLPVSPLLCALAPCCVGRLL